MKQPKAPRLDQRRAKQFETELFARARAWIPSWGMDDDSRDFGRALLRIAARFHSEVAERLDRAGDKMRLGLLDWLAVQGKAARPARLPVVFKLADSARDPILATEPTRLQVEVKGAPVILETERDVYLLPGQLKVLVGVDADKDAFYLPPPGLSSLAPLEPLPTQWRLKNYASAGATKLQLDPELGLAADLLVDLGGLQYRIVQSDKDIATIDPPLTQDQAEQSLLTKVPAFAPFDGPARNRQQHVLYLGHNELFDIEAPATIEIVGAKGLLGTVAWEYWGKADKQKLPGVSGLGENTEADEVKWRSLPLAEDGLAQPDSIVLSKPKGSIEQFEVVEGSSSRWIRAVTNNVPPNQPPLRVDALEVRVNCRHGLPLPPPSAESPAAPIAEGMANTTPLVLNGVFFPLGKEPRQFDAFYLGSKEVFSKKGAEVELDFQMADTTFTTLTAVLEGAFAGTVLAGIARDGALHLLEVNATTGAIGKFLERQPLRPPSSDGNADTPGLALDGPKGRLPLWHGAPDLNGFLVAASAGDAVWVWRERSDDQNASKWEPILGTVPAAAPNPTAPVDDLVFLRGTSPALFALRGGQLSSRLWPSDAQWTPVSTVDTVSTPVVLDAIVPVLIELGGLLVTSDVAGMVGISTAGNLYQVTSAGVCTQLLPVVNVDSGARPVAVLRGSDLVVAFAHTSPPGAAVFHTTLLEQVVPFDETNAEAIGFEAVLSGTDLYLLAAVKLPGGGYLASWKAPTVPAPTIEVFRSDIPSATGTPGGAPTKIGAHVVIPGSAGELLAAEFDLTRRLNLQAAVVGEAIFTAGPTAAFQVGDVVTRDIGTTSFSPFSSRLITEVGTTLDGRIYYLLDLPFAANGALNGLHVTGLAFTAGLATGSTFTLDSGDHATMLNSLVMAGTAIYRVIAFNPMTRVATVAPSANLGGASYWTSTPINGAVAPFMRLNALNNSWDAARLEHATLRFAGASPPQHGKAFSVGLGNHPLLVELSEAWDPAPTAAINVPFVLDDAAGPWVSSLADTTTNPELSWEYWNGTAWWKLEKEQDNTLHLKKSGTLKFKVPPDLSPTDWSGKTNYWIRARLIGGGFGLEKVTVKTSPPDSNGFTTQTVERSSRDIHAPSVIKLGISYEICKEVPPTFVLTQDSGSIRDQSDANRTAGAMVEAFVPVAVLLGRLSDAAPAPAAAEKCPPDCNCPGTTNATASTGSVASPAGASAVPAPAISVPVSGRAVYLGFDAPLFGEPVNVLLLVEERHHDDFAPMTVEALVADRFVPIVVNDATRALGESGVLSLAFPLEPKPRELFGQTLTWVRLTPTGSPASGWKPKLLGAYLNAVWASAAETLTRELVGSSQGEPNLTLYLARPPVLQDTLELRVREPLGEEERDELRAQDKNQVLSEVENLPGDWVLWRRVIDPGDEPPTERVYALDEATGEIRFGDGRHGRIPPVGRDSIVAFKYRRTETGAPDAIDVPANSITARTPLNLVSPLEGVEAVFAADQAAGGAPAESTERVLRFGVANIRHRERALTARDIEDIALESSPDIVQARCFPRKGFVRLVVVMRGADPMPSAAQVRELSRLLLAAAPPSLSATQALRIAGPAVRRLRVDLRLRVASLDDAGAVARGAKQQIVTLFDTSAGGPDQDGWALGENPTEGDIAMVLAGVARLESIADVALREVRDGADRPWPSAIQPNELAMLDKDVIRVQFESLEVIA